MNIMFIIHKQVLLGPDIKKNEKIKKKDICFVKVFYYSYIMNDGCLIMAPICRRTEGNKTPLTT